MMMMLMQVNPDLLSQLAGGHTRLLKELENIEKAKELKVRTHSSLHPFPPPKKKNLKKKNKFGAFSITVSLISNFD